MVVRKFDTGKWIYDYYRARLSGRCVRKQFATKGEALTFENHSMKEAKVVTYSKYH
ncbi:hypothetical protein GCM10011513_05930 [Franconibacter daqui]|nr:hypothetical protein GCM10011513_05930 [Franconibacter daqui]